MPNDDNRDPNEKTSPPKPTPLSDNSFSGFDGNYSFEIKAILKRAYTLSSQNNWTLVLGLASIWAATFTIYLVYLNVFDIEDISLLVTPETPLTPTQQLIIELSMAFVLAPLWTGLTMLAINTQRQISQPVVSIFQYFKLLPALALASICVDIMFKFGFALLIIPGFYIFVATTFTLPLVADKNMGPIKAIICSVKMSNLYIGKMIQLYLLFLVMLVAVFISFGFAYLWVGPFYFNVKAVLYQDLFCQKTRLEPSESDGPTKGIFDA
jgi:hypothetical protein